MATCVDFVPQQIEDKNFISVDLVNRCEQEKSGSSYFQSPSMDTDDHDFSNIEN